MLTKTDRVTADGAVRTARATIAWLRVPRSLPTRRTRTLASTAVVGIDARAASVAIEHLGVAGLRRELRGELEGVAQVSGRRGRPDRLDRQPDPSQVGRARSDDPGRPTGLDDADLAAGRQVAQGVERRVLRRREAVRGQVGRAHARRRVDDEDDVAGQAGRPLDERPRREQDEDERRGAAGAGTGGSGGAAATARWPPRRRRAAARAGSTGRPAPRAAASAGTSRRRPARRGARAARAASSAASAAAQPSTRRRRSSAKMRSLSGTSEDRST